MTMSESLPPSVSPQTELSLTSSAEGSLARTSHAPAKALAWRVSAAAYGASTPVSFASLSQNSLSLKTFQPSSQDEKIMNSRMTAAYAAGLIDGEGCISIAHRNERVFYPRVDVGMSAKALPLLEAMLTAFGGSIQKTRQQSEKWEAGYAWRLFGQPLHRFLTDIRPHLHLKMEQADHALRLQEMINALPRRPNGSASWTAEATKAGKAIKALVQELNQKGPTHTEAPGWFARHAGGTWITSQRDLASPHGWGEFSSTWPRSGLMRNGTAYRLPPLVPLTAETDYGLWPTPTLPNGGRSVAHVDTWTGRSAYHKGKKVQVDLCQAVKMWPTPHGFSQDGKSHGPSGNELGRAVNRSMVATPTSRDWRSGKASAETMAKNARPLSEQIGGSLNPTWVEWLMGFPLGWTDLRD
jgi:hypothetical protein